MTNTSPDPEIRRNWLLKTLIFLFAFLAPNAGVLAEKPSGHVWQARWIGPIPPPAMDLNGAQWIWADEPGVDPGRNAPAGVRTFCRTVNIPDGASVMSATALFAADNRFKLSVNGVSVGGGDSWQHPTRVDLTKTVRSGANEVLIEAMNDADSGAINAAALIGKIRVDLQDKPPMEIVTDASWKSADKPVKVIGPIGSGPWQGISVPATAATTNLWTCFRKRFDLGSRPTAALARIAVDSKYWLWVNGTMVVREGGVKRGPNASDTYYDVVDLAPHLRAGSNQIAALVWYFGKDGFSHKSSGTPGFLFEMDTDKDMIASDRSWRVLRHPSFGDSPNAPNFRLPESSVHFDARSEPIGWMNPGFDDSGWSVPVDCGPPPTPPWNRLWERSIPQWKDFGLKDYTNAGGLPANGGGPPIVAKLPYNAQITPWLKVVAPAGLAIRIGTDNAANEILAEYITREGGQEFETPAWMSGHAVVYQVPAGVRILGLKYRESGFDTELRGRFVSNDDFLNRLWSKCERTLYINMRDTFFDCPDRERAQWWGDIVIQLGQVFYTYDPKAHTLIRKCMYNLCNWQRPSKTLFAPIPAGNWDKELPQQMLASVGKYGFWTYYQNTGDRRTLEDVYPHVKEYLSIWRTDADGLIEHRSGENGWDWADWGENVDIRVLDQAWFCLALEGAARMADELGIPEEAAAYRHKREATVAAANRKFWNGSAYRDPGYGGATDDRAQGMAVVSGIAGSEKFPAIKTVLAREYHASPYLEKYILEALFLMDDAPAAQARLRKRYQEMVDAETTTLWELFDRGGTLNHAWTGGPMTLMFQYMAGIAPTSPGFSTYQVKPRLGGLSKIEAGFESVKGTIDVGIVRSAESFRLTLQSPPGTKATVCVPLAELGHRAVRIRDTTVWLNGAPTGSLPGLTAGPPVNGHATFVVEPGTWDFESR